MTTHHMGVNEGPACGFCGATEAQCARLSIRCCDQYCTHFTDPDLALDEPPTPVPTIAPTPPPAATPEPVAVYHPIEEHPSIEAGTGPLCAETDPEIFFPEKGASNRAAKALCSRCDLREECLETALSERIYFGIWGGTNERDRRRIAEARGLPPPANPYYAPVERHQETA